MTDDRYDTEFQRIKDKTKNLGIYKQLFNNTVKNREYFLKRFPPLPVFLHFPLPLCLKTVLSLVFN
jgi:hypothetical protein